MSAQKRKTHQSKVPRPTVAEMAEKTQFVRECIRRGFTKGRIKDAFRLQFGPNKNNPAALVPSPDAIEDYLRRAKDQIAEDVAAGPDLMRAYLGEFFQGVLGNMKDKTCDRLRAGELFSRLHGLDKAAKTELSGPGGGPLQVATLDVSKMTPEQRATILKADEILSRDDPVGGAPDPAGGGPALPSRNGDTSEPGKVQDS